MSEEGAEGERGGGSGALEGRLAPRSDRKRAHKNARREIPVFRTRKVRPRVERLPEKGRRELLRAACALWLAC